MSKPKFDSSKLKQNERKILEDFHKRRKIFDDYLKKNRIERFTCPSCGYPQFFLYGNDETCTICYWMEDGQDDETADEIWGGPNGELSLTESRLEIGKKLHDLEIELKGFLNLDPKEVMEILEEREKTLSALSRAVIVKGLQNLEGTLQSVSDQYSDTVDALLKTKNELLDAFTTKENLEDSRNQDTLLDAYQKFRIDSLKLLIKK